jgi:hypothetical protein
MSSLNGSQTKVRAHARLVSLCAVAAVAACWPLAASAQPVLTPDMPVDAPLVTASLGDQGYAALAYGAGTYFAVWQDGFASNLPTAIRGARFAADGSMLDDPAITIADPGQPLALPAVAFDGAHFFVVWQGPSTLSTGGQGTGVFGALVDPATGKPGSTFPVVADRGYQTQAVVAGGGGVALVCWTALPAPTIRCSAYQNGAPVSTLSDVLVSDVLNGKVPAVAWGGPTANNFLVAWEVFANPYPISIRAATVSASGASPSVAVNTPPAACASFPYCQVADPTVVSDGSTYLVLWSDQRDAFGGVLDLWGHTLSFAGAPTGADVRFARNTMTNVNHTQALATGANQFFLVWEEVDPASGLSTQYGGRYNAAGMGDGNGFLLSSAPAQPNFTLPSDAASDSRRTAIAIDAMGHVQTAWSGGLDAVTGSDVFALPTDLAGAPSTLPAVASTLVSVGRNYQRAARSVATNGQLFLVVWEDDRNANTTGVDLYGMRFGLDGKPLDAAPFVISNAPGDQFTPAVAALSGGDFLVAWSDGRSISNFDLYAARVGMNGTVKDPNGVMVSGANQARLEPTVAAGAGGWLIAWEDWRFLTEPNTAIYARAMASDGSFSGVERQVTNSGCAAAAVWNGQRYLVAYETPCSQFYASPPIAPDIVGNWVSADGTVNAVAMIASLADAETAPALASDGTLVYAAWRDKLPLAGEAIVAATIVDNAGGTQQLPTTLYSGNGAREAPAIGVTGGAGATGIVTWVDTSPPSVRAMRIDANLAMLDMAPFPVGDTTVFRVAGPVSGFSSGASVPRFTPPGQVAVAPTGEALVAYDAIETLSGRDTARVHVRRLGLLGVGAGCVASTNCAEGICTGGACCDTPCDGICQACGKKGCVETPASDARCPAMPVSCAALSTECRTWTDPPANRCSAYGECAASQALSECTTFSNRPDGTACESGNGSCLDGTCVYASVISPYVRKLPATGGCAVGGRGAPWSWIPLALIAMLALGRRRPRAWLVLLLSGCGGNQVVALDVNLRFDDPVLVATHHARVVLDSADGMSFAATPMPAHIRTGLSVANYDADGDGLVDVVVELGADFQFQRVNHFRLLHDAISAPIHLALRAEAFDGNGNRFAQSAPVQAILNPRQETRVDELHPKCINDCSDGTTHLAAGDAAATVAFPGGELTALAAGNLTGAMPARADLVAGAAHEPSSLGGPNAGEVVIYFGGQAALTNGGDLVITGSDAGDQAGASLAIGDVNHDGLDDLVVGAPGFANDRGAVYILFGSKGGASWPATLGALTATESVVVGAQAGDRLGSAVAILPADAAGPSLLLGADGAATIYAVRHEDLKPGAAFSVTTAPSLVGASGSRLGASLAVVAPRRNADGTPLAADLGLLGQAAAGAPAEGMTGAVYRFAAADLTAPGQPAAPKRALVGQSGGFGATLLFAAVDATQPQALVVAVPGNNAVQVYAASGGDPRVARGSAMVSGLGTSLARLPRADGDLLVAGAPSSAASAAAGAVYVVRGANLQTAPVLQLDAAGRPAAAALAGAHAGDAFGAGVAVGDFDQDGWADLAVAAGAARSILIYRGPLP